MPNSEIPTRGRGYIRTWHALLGMFVVGLAVSVYIHFGIGDGGYLPFILGQAFGFAALPAVVIFPWRWVQKHRGKFTNSPIVAGFIVFIILVYSTITVAKWP